MDHTPAAVPALGRIRPAPRRDRYRLCKSGNTNKSSSRQIVAHATTCACAEPRRRDSLKEALGRRQIGRRASPSPREECMTTVTRRNVIKGGTALAGGMAGILATGRAPAFAQGTTVHWLRWNDFVPASDQLLRKELIPAAEKALGIKINLETVNGNDLQPRITAGIQSGSGPDIIMLFNNHPQIYSESVVDLSDLANSVGKAEGGYYDLCKSNSADGQKWISQPWTIVGAMIAY